MFSERWRELAVNFLAGAVVGFLGLFVLWMLFTTIVEVAL